MILPSIELLPEHLIDQINAGEVIEGPAQVLKELCENSIDAKASSIQIHIKDAGISFMEVCDDGIGISYDQLPYAFHRHATSKLRTYQDLWGLNSFGFRGEALASLASISKLRCQSQTNDEETSSIIEFEGGKKLLHEHAPKRKVAGTIISVTELFFNTPVRLDFLSSKNTELRKLKSVLSHLILAHPQIKWSIKIDQKEKKVYPICKDAEDYQKRLVKVLGESVQVLEQSYDKMKAQLYTIQASDASRGQSFLFINQRPVEDKKIKAITSQFLEQYRSELHSRKFALFIELPKNEVDVNIHPTKSQVKLLNSKVIGVITSMIKDSSNSSLPNPSTPFLEPKPQIRQDSLFENSPQKDLKLSSSKNYDFLSRSVFTPESNSQLIQMNHHYAWLLREENLQFIHLKRFQDYYFQELSGASAPLIIAIPLEISPEKIESFLEVLNSQSFDIEKNMMGTLMVRAIPVEFLKLNFQVILNEFSKKFETKDTYVSLVQKVSPHIKPESLKSFFLDPCLFQELEEKKMAKRVDIHDLARTSFNS